MTLKEQFLDTLPLILDGQKNQGEYETDQNITIGICNHHMLACSDFEDYYCYDCRKKEQLNCTGCLKAKADIEVANHAEDFYRYYSFNQKPIKQNKGYITYINTRSQLFQALSSLKHEVDDWKNYCAKQYELHDDLREYAQQFYQEVTKTHLFPVEDSILPIVFHDSCCDCKQYGSNNISHLITMGRLTTYKKQSQVDIYECEGRPIDEIKRDIRHEVLHYILWASDMNHKDSSAAFHLLCEKYNAHAYVSMPIGEKRLYNKFQKAVKLLEKHKELSEKNGLDFKINYEFLKNTLVMSVGDRKRKSIYKDTLNQIYAMLTKPFTKEEIAEPICVNQKAG